MISFEYQGHTYRLLQPARIHEAFVMLPTTEIVLLTISVADGQIVAEADASDVSYYQVNGDTHLGLPLIHAEEIL